MRGAKHTKESIALIKSKVVRATQEKSTSWKGDKAGYYAVHIWLKKYYGKAYMCSASNCSGKSQNYQWALIKGKKYTHDVDNFMQLCRSCHSKYDYTEKQREFRREYLRTHHIASKGYENKKRFAQA